LLSAALPFVPFHYIQHLTLWCSLSRKWEDT
jgi:hypothetical protein